MALSVSNIPPIDVHSQWWFCALLPQDEQPSAADGRTRRCCIWATRGMLKPTAGQHPAGVGQSAMRRATAGRILDAWRAGQTVARTEATAAAATSTAMLAQGIGKPTPEAFSSSSFLNSR
jgi:hypothetical protein